ncbi:MULTISPECIES: YbfB/YjiJ family MFS transporter [unclassified Massilia]|uniref:YbfB/YjiJ family MFS transporter n=1 Tax=unclassified Massilia TaxID=2609279 RepID=UPI00178592F0|nr:MULTISPECIES: YbfB/YjiJ family MFS transporter [unclassified Massilia]MBD8532430.1 YbfB/YjiJ family MFS transporter [Massilia sp. CFBP 13647]MBD8675744.1 YbfB/YjiJ family MFS transporter [Massilia sp. CFBP 13721]
MSSHANSASNTSPGPASLAARRPFMTAFALSLGAAVSLGLTRFSYALLLPPMRADLDWSYFLAGAMNTGNALGYFLGALATPALMRRYGAQAALAGGAVLASLFMLLSGFVVDAGVLIGQRVLAGIASAFIFISGGLLAARLGLLHPQRAGLLLGMYYGGTGLGITASALLVPLAMDAAAAQGAEHAWQWAWVALAALCLLATLAMIYPARHVDGAPSPAGAQGGFRLSPFGFGLAGYLMFGVGYIGYMTFVIALLKEQGMAGNIITLFYAMLGLAVMASSRIWARMLDRFKGGQAMAILNALLGVATLLPALTAVPGLMFVSGLLFGGIFLSVVASTTALVRHNLPQHAWSAGISAFTTVFALGQIVGPSMIGWIADGPGGLQRGLVLSALALFAGALLASRQRPLQTQ